MRWQGLLNRVEKWILLSTKYFLLSKFSRTVHNSISYLEVHDLFAENFARILSGRIGLGLLTFIVQ